MASEVTSVVIGDYRYTLYDDQTASAQVTDRTKSSYGALRESVTYEGTTYALTNLSYCFLKCSSLTTAPTIPSSVTDMDSCFYSCASLTTVPSIPSGVTFMNLCFRYCTALTGTIVVHDAPRFYSNCFGDTTQPIVLEVTDATETPTWTRIAATGNNGNVTVRDVSANPVPTATVTATRVASRGSTTPDENGQYAYVTVRTTASTEQAPDNVAQAPTVTLDGSAYTPIDPSGTATFTCWVALGDDYGHVIAATPRDLYKTGITVTTTLPSTYSPMEFHATGDGASFGKHATRADVLDVAWDIESDGDVSADGDVNATNVTASGNVEAAGTITGASVGDANGTLADLRDSVSLLKLTSLPTGWKVGFEVNEAGTANERYGLIFFRPNGTYSALRIHLNGTGGVHLASWDSATGTTKWRI